jgi:hemoglobin
LSRPSGWLIKTAGAREPEEGHLQVTMDGIEHRGFLDADAPRRLGDAGLFARIGGQPTIDRMVDALYDRFERDPVLRSLFRSDLTAERANQKRFFAEWMGAGDRYSHAAHAGMKHRHDRLTITKQLAGRWLGHLRRALDASVPAAEDRAIIFSHARAMAFALVNEESAARRSTRSERAKVYRTEQACALAHKGDLRGLRAFLEDSPQTFHRPIDAAAILQVAVLAGRPDVVKLLLEAGVDPDKPHYLPIKLGGRAFERVLFVTPLCAARLERRPEVEALLLERGAREDLFTAAFLGDVSRLEQQLASCPDLAQVCDPATDVVEITPLHHAVAGGRPEAVRTLLSHEPGPLRGSLRALRGAADHGSLEMVTMLLERGAQAVGLGPGRWVLDERIAPLLARAGASLRGPSNHWVRASCTGNQGRKDDPDYVRALLQYGASVDDRYAGATPLHHAAKAGFIGTMKVLLDQGADSKAPDDKGLTPIEWVERAAKTIDREPVRRLLRSQARTTGAVRPTTAERRAAGRR